MTYYTNEETSNRIDKGFLAKEKLDELEDTILRLCDLNYQEGQMKLRKGVTVEDFISGIAMTICGYTSKWEAMQVMKELEDKAYGKEEA
tara:strand:- start:192 stop:458 length:267 start_codon:yes stop_codon:yes gene_type:complete